MAGVPAQAFEPVRKAAPILILFLLASVCFSLATLLQPRTLAWNRGRDSGSVLKVLLGDSRRLFANHFFTKADVEFHSGYYPSIFDQAQAPKDTAHLTAREGSSEEEEHEKAMNFLGPPRDWIERFGRHFFITQHTHLEGGNEREILPWLRISAELDPQRVDTYTVAAFWLRDLGKVEEAEQFLREGLRNNPTSYELLFELGRLYSENYHDLNRARNVWELALRRWSETEPTKKEPDLIGYHQIVIHLGRLEEQAGNFARAIECLELAVRVSPSPEALQEQIAELKQKMAAQSGTKPAGR
jgi:tetratricopeptide (TPR) repeat protein